MFHARSEVLVVLHDPGHALTLCTDLHAAGFHAQVIQSCDQAAAALEASGVHAILFERSHFDLCDCAWACTLRNRHLTQHVPLLTFTASVVENKVPQSLNTAGPSGLGVRLKEFLRHFNSSEATRLQLQDITLDAVGDRVTRRGRPIHLSPIQFRLLAYFMRNPHQVLTQQQLLVNVWGRSTDPGRTVAMCVAGLRKALGDQKTNTLIRTVRGRGYTLSFDRETSPPNESTLRTIEASTASTTASQDVRAAGVATKRAQSS